MQPQDRERNPELVTIPQRIRSFRRSYDLSPDKLRSILKFIPTLIIVYIPSIILNVMINLFRLLYDLILKFAKYRLNLLCLICCTALLIIAIYIPLNRWAQVGIVVLILFVSSVGITFLDYKYKVLESDMEDNVMGNLRKQLSVGIPDQHIPQQDKNAATVIAKMPEEDRIALVFKQFGYDVRFCDMEESNTEHKLIFYSNTPNLRSSREMLTMIKEVLNLPNVPIVHSSKNMVYLHITKP